jgi:hypothetical protein
MVTEFGLPLGDSILLSLMGLAAITILLSRYYGGRGHLDVSTAEMTPAASPMPRHRKPR